MKKIILLLFSFAKLDPIIGRFFELAETDDQLQVKAIVDQELPTSFSNIMSHIGFLGTEVTKNVESIISNEYQNRAKETLDSIKERSKEDDYQLKAELVFRESLTDLKEELKDKQIKYLLISYTKDQFIVKDVLGYKLEEFLSGLDLPIEVYYDGELAENINYQGGS